LHSGSAAHGDYLFGWKDDTLQKAMDNNCNLNADCSKAGIHKQADATYSACTKKQQAPEDTDGCKTSPFPLFTSCLNRILILLAGLTAMPMGEMLRKA
jgi:hypothetical protein